MNPSRLVAMYTDAFGSAAPGAARARAPRAAAAAAQAEAAERRPSEGGAFVCRASGGEG